MRHSRELPVGAPFRPYRDPFKIGEKPARESKLPEQEVDGDASMASPEPAAKKPAAAVQVRIRPDVFTLKSVPADGDCFFHVVTEALNPSRGPEAALTAKQARAETIAHLRKYREYYLPMWDRRTDQDAPTDDFDGYLERLSHSGVYAGGLEVLAAARHYKFTAVIIPEDSTLPVMALHLKGTLPRVYFWYTGKHYDLLLLDAGKSLPTSIQDALHESLAAAVPRGGGPGSTASFASTAPSGLKDLWASQRRDPVAQNAQSDHRKTAEFVAVDSLPGVSADPAPASSSLAQRVQSPTGETGTGKSATAPQQKSGGGGKFVHPGFLPAASFFCAAGSCFASFV